MIKDGARERVCAVFVTFNPGQKLIENVFQLANQVECVLIIDNKSNETTLNFLFDLQKLHSNVIFVLNNKNFGIAYALNQAIEYAKAKGFDWLATFDQDSFPPDNLITNLFDVYMNHPNREQIAILTPMHRDAVSNKVYEADPLSSLFTRNLKSKYREVTTTLTSGNLLRIAACNQIGVFCSDLFIDYVDHDFCLRCRESGWRIVVVLDIFLSHSLGEKGKNFAGKIITQHNPVRNYYQSRNRIFVYQRHCIKNPTWVLRDIIYSTKKTLDALIFGDQKLIRLKMIVLGTFHAMIGHRGSFN